MLSIIILLINVIWYERGGVLKCKQVFNIRERSHNKLYGEHFDSSPRHYVI